MEEHVNFPMLPFLGQSSKSPGLNTIMWGDVNNIEAFPGWTLAVESKGVQISEYTLLREWAIRGPVTWIKKTKAYCITIFIY